MKPTTTKEVPWVDAAIRYAHLQSKNDATAAEDGEAEDDDLPHLPMMMDVIILI